MIEGSREDISLHKTSKSGCEIHVNVLYMYTFFPNINY